MPDEKSGPPDVFAAADAVVVDRWFQPLADLVAREFGIGCYRMAACLVDVMTAALLASCVACLSSPADRGLLCPDAALGYALFTTRRRYYLALLDADEKCRGQAAPDSIPAFRLEYDGVRVPSLMAVFVMVCSLVMSMTTGTEEMSDPVPIAFTLAACVIFWASLNFAACMPRPPGSAFVDRLREWSGLQPSSERFVAT